MTHSNSQLSGSAGPSAASGGAGGGSSTFSTSHAAGTSTVTSLGTTAAGTEITRTLFDPRRHDPVKFAMSKRLPGVISLSQPQSVTSSNASGGHAHGSNHHHHHHGYAYINPLQHHHHLGLSGSAASGGGGGGSSALESSGASISTGSPSVTSSEASRERRRRRAPSSRSNPANAAGSESGAGSEAGASASGGGPAGGAGGSHAGGADSGMGLGATEGNAYVNEIKRVYKLISNLESQLKEQAIAGMAAGSTLGLLGPGSSGKASLSSSTSLASLDPLASGAKSNGSLVSTDDGVDHLHWANLAAQHKSLAELMAAFMELTWRPNLPASFAALPQNYNIATRIWATAIHSYLEQVRHALPFASPQGLPASCDKRGVVRQAALLDHLEEFIYFAYAYYSNLHEAETFARFRTVWLENLGDLARYRMAVATFRLALAAWEAKEKEATRERDRLVAHEAPDSPSLEPSSQSGGGGLQLSSAAAVAAYSRIDDEDEPDDGGDEADSADEHASAPRVKVKRQRAQHQDGGVRGGQGARRVFEAPSIGEAALGDWVLEEKETWRETARGWYAKGLAEVPGTGRLHHHLGLLSRNREDLEGLYHLAKSMTTSHPYAASRETLLPMCTLEQQTRRLEPGASPGDLFIHIHAMLFTRVDLDNFEDVFARYKESIKTALAASSASVASGLTSRDAADETYHRRSASPMSDQTDFSGEGVIPESSWMIFGAVGISALLQYGAVDGLLSAPPTTHTSSKDAQRPAKGKVTQKVKSQTPTAIMLNKDTSATASTSSSRSPLRSSVGLPQPDEDGEAADGTTGGEGDNDAEGDEDREDHIISLQQPAFDPSSIPLTFVYAARMAFDTLDIVIEHCVTARKLDASGSRGGNGGASAGTDTEVPNPYITMLLTFLLTIFKQPNALIILERWVPWQALADLANGGPDAGAGNGGGSGPSIIPTANALAEIPSKVTGGMPLPEDWCLRGMSWVSRRVFERGFWKPKAGSDWLGSGLPIFESEIDVLDHAKGVSSGLSQGDGVDSEAEVGDGPGASLRGNTKGALPVGSIPAAALAGASAPAPSIKDPLARLRWSRIGYAVGSLARTVPGLDARQNRKTGKNSLVIVPPLASKIAAWKAEDEALRSAEVEQKVKSQADDEEEADAWEEDSDSGQSSDDEDNETLSEAVRELKARRRQLKQALKDAKKDPSSLLRPPATRRTSKHVQRKAAAAGPTKPPVSLDALPGYTTLVLDTNLILLPVGDLLRTLVESKRWTVILPLAVITELDGLGKNRSQLGQIARDALKYIEESLRSHSKWLKIQTSRGNYLYDLNIRFELFDFAGVHGGKNVSDEASADPQQRKTMQARNLDEIILRAAIWQEEHSVNRVNVVLSDCDRAEREATLAKVTPKTAKVVLITLDRNLRIKARARGIKAASNVELLDVVVGNASRPNG